jgi:hypothetical protein
MLRRATTGDRQPIYQGGKLVGYRRQRSDNLLMFALLVPEILTTSVPEILATPR